jgi:hypothetical protein
MDSGIVSFTMSSETERLPPPNSAGSFESLCLDLWSEIWGNPGAVKNGRNGQPQAGVDVFGMCGGKWMGVQCKQKDDLLWSRMTCRDLQEEVEKAKTFVPPLASFTLATSGPASVDVQELARVITDRHHSLGLFTVEVWSWEKIWHELYSRQDLLKRLIRVYWPNIGGTTDSILTEKIAEAKDMIRRLRLCGKHGSINTPEEDRVRHSESEAWYSGTGGIISAIFGENSYESNKWKALASKVYEYMEEGLRREWGPFEGYINHLHHSVGLLTELQVRMVERDRTRESTITAAPVTEESHLQILTEHAKALLDAQRYQREKDDRESQPLFIWRDGSQTKERMVCNFQNIGGRIRIQHLAFHAAGRMSVVPMPWLDRNQLGSVVFEHAGGLSEYFQFEITYQTSLGKDETKRFSVRLKDGKPEEEP